MPALDTNVLVRLIVEDDAGQLATAQRLLSRCAKQGCPLFVPVTVVLELEWVLSSRFGRSKQQVIEALDRLLAAPEFRLEAPTALEVALELYKTSNAEFADCLHIAMAGHRDRPPLWTFDRVASRVAGARLLVQEDGCGQGDAVR